MEVQQGGKFIWRETRAEDSKNGRGYSPALNRHLNKVYSLIQLVKRPNTRVSTLLVRLLPEGWVDLELGAECLIPEISSCCQPQTTATYKQ